MGLSTGTVLVFGQHDVCQNLLLIVFLISDTKQQLRACLTPPSGPEKFGAISAVSINFDSTRLLVGYARGPVSVLNYQ